MTAWISSRGIGFSIIVLVVGLFGACGQKMGETCSDDSDCQTGICTEVFDGYMPVMACTTMCTTSSCPSGFICGTNREGLQVCMRPCTWDHVHLFACIDGAPTACDALTDERYCPACGCDGEGEVCRMMSAEPDSAQPPFCGPPAQPGEECNDNTECASEYCLNFWYDNGEFVSPGPPAYCSVFVGDACETGNCLTCLDDGDATICTHGCWQDASCPAGTRCARRDQNSEYYCWKTCTLGNGDCRPELSCEAVGDGYNILYYACL